MIKYKLLIAEDDPIEKNLFKVFLDKDEFDTLFAKNGLEALEIIKNGEKIDLVLMDIKMPEMDGFVAGGLIKKLVPDIPIIAQSSYTEDIVKNRIDRKVFNEFLNKPINKNELFAILNKYLQMH